MHSGRAELGQATVELALSIVLFLVVVVGIIEVSQAVCL